jgi:tetratricopeptide (TPR) repeat protein
MTARHTGLVALLILALAPGCGEQDRRDLFFDHVGRAQKAHERGDYEEAIEQFTRAIDVAPNEETLVMCLSIRAGLHILRHDLDAAIADYGRLIKEQPNHPEHRNSRAWMYLGKGDLQKALADANGAVERDPKAHFLDTRAWAHFHLGDLDRAEQDLDAAVRADPTLHWLRALRFRIDVARGKRDQALEGARRFLDAAPLDRETRPTRLLLGHLLGQVPRDELRDSDHWVDFDIATRGWEPASGRP